MILNDIIMSNGNFQFSMVTSGFNKNMILEKNDFVNINVTCNSMLENIYVFINIDNDNCNIII